MRKFDPKVESCLFKVKFSTQTNSDIKNSIVMFTFSFSTENTLFGQIWFQNSKSHEVKLVTQSHSDMWNAMIIFTFSIFDRKYPLRTTLVQKIKIVKIVKLKFDI